MFTQRNSRTFVPVGALLSGLALSSCGTHSKEQQPGLSPEALESSAHSLVLRTSSPHLEAPAETSLEVAKAPTLAMKLAQSTGELTSIAEKQAALSASLGGPSVQEILEKAGKGSLIPDLVRSRDALQGLDESSPEHLPALASWWNNAGLLVAATHSNNLQLRVFARAALELSELAHNEPLIERFDKELLELRTLGESLTTLSLAAAAELKAKGIDTSSVRVTIRQPEFAPPGLERDWRTMAEGALRASDLLDESTLLSPDQSVGEARTLLSQSLGKKRQNSNELTLSFPGQPQSDEEPPLRTSAALREMLTAGLLIRSASDQLKDDILVATIVKKQLEDLPAGRRPEALVDRAGVDVEIAVARLKMLQADMKEALIAYERLETLNRAKDREFKLNTEGARIRFNK